MVFALIVAVPMLRFRGLYFTIGSLVLAEALGIFMSNFNGFGGNAGITLTGTAPSPLLLIGVRIGLVASDDLRVADHRVEHVRVHIVGDADRRMRIAARMRRSSSPSPSSYRSATMAPCRSSHSASKPPSATASVIMRQKVS